MCVYVRARRMYVEHNYMYINFIKALKFRVVINIIRFNLALFLISE